MNSSMLEFCALLFCRRNLSRAVTLLEMIKRREKTKREHVHLGIEIFEKRYQAKDFNGFLLAEYTNNAMKNTRFVLRNKEIRPNWLTTSNGFFVFS